MTGKNSIKDLKEKISEERKIVREMVSLLNSLKRINNTEEANLVIPQINSLKSSIKNIEKDIAKTLELLLMAKPLHTEHTVNNFGDVKEEGGKEVRPLIQTKFSMKRLNLLEIEKETLIRLRVGKKKFVSKKVKKPSKYVKISNDFFANFSEKLVTKYNIFKNLKRELIKANIPLVPNSYVSVILSATALSLIISIFILLFFLFFKLVVSPPFITQASGSILSRFATIFWIVLVIPFFTFIFMYFYPSMEKKSIASKIDRELPFATIHMSAIAGSMIDPSKIFNIIIMTGEYKNIEKEFIKIINEINIYGYDLVTALKHVSFNTSSKRFAELLNGLTTTITSGGNLPDFFDKRSQSLLFSYRLEEERQTKAAETFMDIYISLVIAAPMILMLLLMMMNISGMGLSLSSNAITLIMVLGVTVINLFSLTFLHLKQPPK